MKDGKNKITKKYFDKDDNLKKEKKIIGDSTLTTKYIYDNLYRLTSVTSPTVKITTYQYDKHININQKTSPAEGTTRYKDDNLRFSINTGESVSLIFNNYDNFN